MVSATLISFLECRDGPQQRLRHPEKLWPRQQQRQRQRREWGPLGEHLDLEGVLLLATPVATDSTIIMEGELLDDDNEPGTPSGTRRSASLVDNNGLGTSSSASRSTSVDNNGPSNRVSISDLDLVLVSSGSQGSSGGGSGGRRSASNDQVIIR